jgi:hypothetical protein
MENVLEKACALSAWDRIALNRLKIAVRCFGREYFHLPLAF